MDADRGPLRALEPKHLFDAVLLERCDVRDKAQGARKAWVDQQRLGFRNGIERCGEALFSQARERREVQYGIAVARAAVSTVQRRCEPRVGVPALRGHRVGRHEAGTGSAPGVMLTKHASSHATAVSTSSYGPWEPRAYLESSPWEHELVCAQGQNDIHCERKRCGCGGRMAPPSS